MPRLEKQLHTWREPVGLRPAATLMLLRDAIDEQSRPCIEVLMTRRSMTASFAPGAYVFPGGALDEADGQLIGSPTLPQQVHESATVEALAVASIREAFEELGVLLVHLPESIRVHNLDRDLPLTPQLKACQGQYATDMLASFSHWQTDRDLPRRFDVRFFVARMPAGQVAIADEKDNSSPSGSTRLLALHAMSAANLILFFRRSEPYGSFKNLHQSTLQWRLQERRTRHRITVRVQALWRARIHVIPMKKCNLVSLNL